MSSAKILRIEGFVNVGISVKSTPRKFPAIRYLPGQKACHILQCFEKVFRHLYKIIFSASSLPHKHQHVHSFSGSSRSEAPIHTCQVIEPKTKFVLMYGGHVFSVSILHNITYIQSMTCCDIEHPCILSMMENLV